MLMTMSLVADTGKKRGWAVPLPPARPGQARTSRDACPHDRPRRAAARDLLEPGLAEGRRQSRPREGGRDVALCRLDRIPFDDAPALAARQVDRGTQERHGHAAATVLPADEQAGDRPDRRVVHGFHDTLVGQDGVVRAWCHGTPGDRLAAPVGQNTGRRSRQNDLAEGAPVARPLGPLVLGSLPPPVHAPAAGARSARSEQPHEIGPAGGGEGADGWIGYY